VITEKDNFHDEGKHLACYFDDGKIWFRWRFEEQKTEQEEDVQMVQPDTSHEVTLEGPLGALLQAAFETELRRQSLPLFLCLVLNDTRPYKQLG
jgi:hypothetical protein